MIVVNTQFRDDSGFAQLRHPPYLGLTLADFVFPQFAFLAGVGIPGSVTRALGKRVSANGDSISAAKRDVFLKEILPRSVKLFTLGVALGVPYALATAKGSFKERLAFIRVWGVLQRHAAVLLLCGAGYLYTLADPNASKPKEEKATWKWLVRRLAFPVATTAAWLYFTFYFPFPNTDNSKTLSGLFPIERIADEKTTAAYWLDLVIVGLKRMYRHGLDPEGALGTLTGVINVWMGILLGEHLATLGEPDLVKIGATAAVLAAKGLVLSRAPFNIPFSKKLWTPTFALMTSAFSLASVAAVFAYSKWRKLVSKGDKETKMEQQLVQAGQNSLSIYVVQSYLPHALFLIPDMANSVGDKLREGTVTRLFGKSGLEGLVWGIGWAAACMGLAAVLQGKGWVVKV